MRWPKLSKTFDYVLGYLAPNMYELDLSNEVLSALVGEEAAKISEVKVGGRKKSARSAGPRVHQVREGLCWQFLTNLQL